MNFFQDVLAQLTVWAALPKQWLQAYPFLQTGIDALCITLPLAAPGLVAAGLLGFARAFGEFGATVTFAGAIPGETQTLPLAIYSVLQSAGGDQVALRLSVVAVLVSVVAVVGSEMCNRRILQARRA